MRFFWRRGGWIRMLSDQKRSWGENKGRNHPLKTESRPRVPPCDSRDRPSVREVLRTTDVGGLVASWSADFGCSSDGGLLGRGVAVGSNNATVESACSKRASYSPNLLEGVFSEVLRGRS